MPDRLSYDEAMQYAQHCLKIQEPDIKQGAVETYAVKTAVGEIKKPWGREGGFAVVYKFRTLSGQMKAMRCFRAAMSPDIQSRYEQMSRFFRQHLPDITIDYRYYENGILVKETSQSSQKKVCPVIVMEWIEGATLLDKVDEICKQHDCQALGQLAEQWLEMLQQMRRVHMAHGDLAAVNIMVRPNGRMVLIDYDGVYIPAFASMPQVVLGQQGYQHPDMINRPFNAQMDDFSAIVIYLSLLALQAQPELWDKYVKRNAKGQLDGNMLFTGDDFAQPEKSLLFAELLRSPETRVRDLARMLMDTCKQPVGQVSFPTHLLDPDYMTKLALQQLERAIQQNNDEQILRLWVEPLASYAPAQIYLPRVTEARQRAAALDALKQAVATQDIFLIASAACSHPALTTHPRLSGHERTIIRLASTFVQAYNSDDDDRIVNSWQEIQQGPHQSTLKLAPQQQQRLDLAQQRKGALVHFRLTCYRSRNAHEIVSAYQPILDGSPGISAQEREKLEAARHYIVMYNAIKNVLQMNSGKGDIAQLLAVYDEELDKRFTDFTDGERKQITVLQNFGKLDRALLSKAYRLALVTAREIEMQMRAPISDARLSIARMNFVRAFEARNVQAHLQGGQAFVRWDWPNDDLVQFAVLVWSSDHWPLHPRKDDPGRTLYRVNRGFYEQYGYFQFPFNMTSHIYIQVFFAMSEFLEQTNEQVWFYSRGNEPTSKWPLQLVS